MRLRNERLRTGRMLSHFATDRRDNQNLLFLVSGTADASALAQVEEISGSIIEGGGLEGFEWFYVADRDRLAELNPNLPTGHLFTLEAIELADLAPGELEAILTPALSRLATHPAEALFPRVGGAVGSPAKGVQFLDRERELAQVSELVNNGRDVMLQAPRRSGKTSLLHRIAQELDKAYATCVWDLERHDTPEHTVARLASLVFDEGFRSALGRARQNRSAVLREAIGALYERSRVAQKKGALLLIDEFSWGIKKVAASGNITQFLAELASALDEYGTRLVVAGSYALDWALEDAGVEPEELPERFRALARVPVSPLATEEPEIRRLLLGSGVVATPDDITWLRQKIDLTLPYPALLFLDKVTSRLLDSVPARRERSGRR